MVVIQEMKYFTCIALPILLEKQETDLPERIQVKRINVMQTNYTIMDETSSIQLRISFRMTRPNE